MRKSELKRKTPLNARVGLHAKKGLNRVSDKQKLELRQRAKIKRELITEAPKDERGIPICPDCGKPVDWDWRSPNGDLAHIQRLSDGGKTTKENGRIKCRHCHSLNDHHLKEIL